MVKNNSRSARGKIDLATLTGLLVALCGILGGLLLEGGRLGDISQLNAALIVLGGTVGAVMVTTPSHILLAAVKKVPSIFWQPAYTADGAIAEILKLAGQARRTGIVSLDAEISKLSDPFLRKAVALVVDGTDLKEMRSIMELELDSAEQRGESVAKVFESAGGYAPTVGIIGAVMGLIQVMKNLSNLEAVGHGIAVAFVATIYGIFLANILFLPAANKLRARLQSALLMKEMAIEGVQAIVEGMNPILLENKLESYRGPLGDPTRPEWTTQTQGARQATPVRSTL